MPSSSTGRAALQPLSSATPRRQPEFVGAGGGATSSALHSARRCTRPTCFCSRCVAHPLREMTTAAGGYRVWDPRLATQLIAPLLPSLAYLPSGTICLATALTEPAAAAATADQATRSASNPLSPAYAPKVSPSSASCSLGHGCRYLYNKNVPLLLLTFAMAGAHYLFDKMCTPCLASNCAWSTSRVPSL